jgi:hypothetical protein
LLKVKKSLINIRTLLKQIDPSEFTKIIDKAYIVLMFPNRKRCWSPYIREDLFQGNNGSTSGDGVWQLMTLGELTRVTYIRSTFWSVVYFISSKNLLNDKRRGMAKATMPRGRRRLYCEENMLGGRRCGGHQGIETSMARTFKQSSTCCSVLDQKIERMKLNKGMIIKSKTVDRQKIFSGSRNM